MKVMFVDDDAINNEINKLLLAKLYPDIEVIIKSSVDDALHYLYENSDKLPQKIFLDVNLPIKSGWDFINEYKETGIEGVDLYMLTSALDLLDPEIRNKFPEVTDFVEKPLYDYKLAKIFKG